MAIYLKDYISPPGSSVTGTGTVTGPSDEYAYHAMRIGKPGETVTVSINNVNKTIDADGCLIYTKVLLNGTEEITLTDGSGFAYNGLEDMVDGMLDDGTTEYNSLASNHVESGREAHETNIKHRYHEQMRFDNLKLSYFLNNKGMLVARYKQNYTHGEPV